jgi:FKBP-type peptidyl-prolyl cis-trans isomerase
MVRLTKFESIGLGVSVLVMALALYLLRVETTVLGVTAPSPQTAVAANAVVVTQRNGTEEQARIRALYEAANEQGKLEKMVIEDIKVGTGDKVVADGDTVVVHYTGRLQSGEEFDSSRPRGEAFTFTVGEGRVIPGWEQGLLGMKIGGERILVIPPELAYGNRQVGPIPPKATLVFAIELLEIK